MKKTPRFALAATALALAVTGVAATGVAAQGAAASQRADRNADLTRADALAQAEARFARMDVNGDGRVTAEDRTQARAQMREAMFTRLDTDRNGSISRAEWDAAGEAMKQRREARGAQAGERRERAGRGEGRRGHHMRGMGRGGQDRVIERAAFMEQAAQRFDRMDADSNGVVTAAERQAARAAMREQRQERGRRAAPPAGQ